MQNFGAFHTAHKCQYLHPRMKSFVGFETPSAGFFLEMAKIVTTEALRSEICNILSLSTTISSSDRTLLQLALVECLRLLQSQNTTKCSLRDLTKGAKLVFPSYQHAILEVCKISCDCWVKRLRHQRHLWNGGNIWITVKKSESTTEWFTDQKGMNCQIS